MHIFLDFWLTLVCLLLSVSFPINTPSTSKAPTTLPGFLPSKSPCCHGNLMFSWELNQQHPMIASMKAVQTPIPLKHTGHTLPHAHQFLLAIIHNIKLNLAIQSQDYLKINSCIHPTVRGNCGRNLSHYKAMF